MDHYLNIFLESAWHATVIPFGTEPTFFAMRGFGGFDMGKAFLLAWSGGSLGQACNWLLGCGLLRLKCKERFRVSEYWYGRVQTAFNRYLLFLLLLSWAPALNMTAVAAGFLGAPVRIALPLLVIGQAVYYGYYAAYSA